MTLLITFTDYLIPIVNQIKIIYFNAKRSAMPRPEDFIYIVLSSCLSEIQQIFIVYLIASQLNIIL